jgi:hypothetical protein
MSWTKDLFPVHKGVHENSNVDFSLEGRLSPHEPAHQLMMRSWLRFAIKARVSSGNSSGGKGSNSEHKFLLFSLLQPSATASGGKKDYGG